LFLLLSLSTIPCSKDEILQKILTGGYPSILELDSQAKRMNWFDAYTSLTLQKDVLELSRIENITHIPNLLKVLAARVGGLLNMEELARSLQLPVTTVNRHLTLLQTLFLVYLLPAWSSNLGKKVVKSPKVYLIDTFLLLAFLKMDKERILQNVHFLEKIFENFVVLEILKQISWSRDIISMYHFRDYKNYEVDIVLEGKNGNLVGIEVKSGQTISKEDFNGLQKLQEISKEKFFQGILLYAGDRFIPFSEKIGACPISSLWMLE